MSKVLFVAHKNESLLSRAIRWFRPPYSHIEMWFYTRPAGTSNQYGTVISADSVGVVAKPIPFIYKSGKGTIVDTFEYVEPLSERECDVLWEAANSLVGRTYDTWELVFGFTLFKTRSPKNSIGKKLICSGAVLLATQMLDKKSSRKRALLNYVREDKVSPVDLTRSPLLKFNESFII